MDELSPTRILSPGLAEARPGHVVTDHGRVIDVPAPMVVSVGDLPGLSPRRRKGDGGEVPGADVDLVDALDRAVVWPTVAAWLTDTKAVNTRRARLADLAAFLRWLEHHAPQVGLLAVDEDNVAWYRETIGTGRAEAGVSRVGVPLSAATVARRMSTLTSLYAYAKRRLGLSRNPADPEVVKRPEVSTVGKTRMLSREESARLLRAVSDPEFVQAYPTDAALARMLFVLGVRVSEALSLTVDRIEQDGEHWTALIVAKGGDERRVPLPPEVMGALRPLLDGRGPDDAVFAHEDGTPFNRDRVQTTMRRAAKAARIDGGLTPHMGRVGVVTVLLKAGVPAHRVQGALGHRKIETTMRYSRDRLDLDGHPLYRVAGEFAGDE